MAAGLLTPQDAAVFLAVSTRTLERLRKVGGGPDYVRITERRLGYDPAALEEYRVARTFPHRAAEMARGAPETKLAGSS